MVSDSGLGQLGEEISDEVPRHFTGVRTRPILGLTVVVRNQYSAWSRTKSASSTGSLWMRSLFTQIIVLADGNLLTSKSTVVCSMGCSLGTSFDILEDKPELLISPERGYHSMLFS